MSPRTKSTTRVAKPAFTGSSGEVKPVFRAGESAVGKTAVDVADLVGKPFAGAQGKPQTSDNSNPSNKNYTSDKGSGEVSYPVRNATANMDIPHPAGVSSAPASPSLGGPVRPQINGSSQFFYGPRDLADENIQTMDLAGVLEVMPEGHGYLRPKFIPSDKDVYISSSQIRRFVLRAGDWVEGVGRPPKETERYYGLLRVDKVNAVEADKMMDRPWFDDLVPIYPDKQIKLETGEKPLSTRIIDLVAPIGRGQRGLIVSPPKAGKTWLLKEIANGVTTNYPDYHLMVALVGERPEEVTDISRGTKGEVIASNFDQSPVEQVRVAEVTLERAKRLVEMGKNVVVLLDSITRLARAYNLAIPPSGRTLSGGFDPAALFPPKQFLGAARCVEDGGSLTIIGTALVNTDSRMDDLIYEEFKGTGNMELHLDRKLAEARTYPAIDVGRSGTRNFERLVDEKRLKQLDTLIKMLHLLNDSERTEVLLSRLQKSKSNEEFLESLTKGE